MDRNLFLRDVSLIYKESLSARRAWIEMLDSTHRQEPFPQSLSARRAWIEIASGTLSDTSDVTSLSARRAWIEISRARI